MTTVQPCDEVKPSPCNCGNAALGFGLLLVGVVLVFSLCYYINDILAACWRAVGWMWARPRGLAYASLSVVLVLVLHRVL